MTDKSPSNAAQRSKLKLRQRPTGEWEVYASVHGTATYRWWIISFEKAEWYKQRFPEIQVINFEEP